MVVLSVDSRPANKSIIYDFSGLDEPVVALVSYLDLVLTFRAYEYQHIPIRDSGGVGHSSIRADHDKRIFDLFDAELKRELFFVSSVAQSVYLLVTRIPRGRVLSYGDVGRIIGTGPRQVAAAMRGCPGGVPWHRVVGAGGRIRTPGEYAWMQRERLLGEGIRFRGLGFSYEVYRWQNPR